MDCKKTPLVMLDRMVAGRVYKVEEGEAEFIYSFLDTDCDRRRDETYVKKPTANSADPEDFEVQRLPKFNWKPHVFAELQFTAIRGRHGTIPIRVLNPYSAMYRKRGENGALVYFHGGGHCTGGVGDLEKGLRLLAHASSCQVNLFPNPMLRD
jgi:acetyl esterase/lipase